MINIEKILRQSLEIIKLKCNLPESGFIAGGSLANIAWEIISGNKAIINDIDVFVFDKQIEYSEEDFKNKKYNFIEKDKRYYEDYTGICYTSIAKDFYSILDCKNDGILNFIYYQANKNSLELVISSFDLNCVQVGYSIVDDEFYWTKGFEEFLNTGKLKAANLLTPTHTLLRIVKKKYELNASIDQFEFDILEYTIYRQFRDLNKRRFKEKYLRIYEKYKDDFPNFELRRDTEIEGFILKNHKKITDPIYKLDIKNIRYVEKNNLPYEPFRINENIIFNDDNLSLIYLAKDLLFYMRNIYFDDDKKILWSKLHYFFNEEYFDMNYQENKGNIDLLCSVINLSPSTIENLKGFKLSQQIKIINNLFVAFNLQPHIAISVLEKNKITPDMIIDDSTALILELSVRKEIIFKEEKYKDVFNYQEKVSRSTYNSNSFNIL